MQRLVCCWLLATGRMGYWGRGADVAGSRVQPILVDPPFGACRRTVLPLIVHDNPCNAKSIRMVDYQHDAFCCSLKHTSKYLESQSCAWAPFYNTLNVLVSFLASWIHTHMPCIDCIALSSSTFAAVADLRLPRANPTAGVALWCGAAAATAAHWVQPFC